MGKTAVRSVAPPSATIAEEGRKRAGLAMIAAEGMIAIATIAMVPAVPPPSARPTTTIAAGGKQRARRVIITDGGRRFLGTINAATPGSRVAACHF